jgi:hypothetical protein
MTQPTRLSINYISVRAGSLAKLITAHLLVFQSLHSRDKPRLPLPDLDQIYKALPFL